MHEETDIQIAWGKLLDGIRKQWGDIYPAEIANEVAEVDALINPIVPPVIEEPIDPGV